MLRPMLLWLLACTPDSPPPGDPFTGSAELTLTGASSGPEAIALSFVGWSTVGDGLWVLSAEDLDRVYELMVVLDAAPAEGAQTPAQLRWRKGLQALLDAEATCSLTLSPNPESRTDNPWEAALDCTGLHTEAGLGTEEAPWSLAGTLRGGAWVERADRAEALAGPFYAALPALRTPAGTVPADDPDGALVVPWRAGEVKVVWEDGDDGSRDDVALSLVPGDTEITLRRWTREQADPDGALELWLGADQSFTAAVEGSGQESTGAEHTLTLWDSVLEGADDLRVLLR